MEIYKDLAYSWCEGEAAEGGNLRVYFIRKKWPSVMCLRIKTLGEGGKNTYIIDLRG